MAKIFFSNNQFKKLYEIAYLGVWLKTSNYAPQDAGFDTSAQDLLEYLEQFAKAHGMTKFLNNQGKFTSDYDDYMMPIIEEFNETVMYDELAERLSKRDFILDHKRPPIFNIFDPTENEYDKRFEYREKYDNEFEEYGLERLKIVGNS